MRLWNAVLLLKLVWQWILYVTLYQNFPGFFPLPISKLGSIFSDEDPVKNDKLKRREPVHISIMSRPTERKLHLLETF